MKWYWLLFLLSLNVFAEEIPIPYDSMRGCQRHFASWGKVENVQVRSFSDAFPKTVWEGTLEERVTRFQDLWKDNVKVVDDVKFDFTNNEGAVTSSQKKSVIVISTKDLTPEQIEKLKTDYTEAMSWLTVSHPLSERGGHLYTRVGNKAMDYFGWFTKGEYYIPEGSERLEPIIHLSPEEQFRLNTYMKNVSKNPKKVLGENSYNGASNSTGKLTDNKPLQDCGGHNCTSWVGLAPIGDENQPLLKLVGASRGWNIHTNPGWWMQTLTGVAPKERVPYVAYFSSNSLEEILASRVKSNELLIWDFGLH